MKVSFIIVNYNGKDCIEKCIKSILNQDYPKNKIEIIVVDNNSPDKSWKLVEKYKKVKLIKCSKNNYFAKGNNIGFEYASGDYIALINNDITIERDWIKKMIERIEKDSKIGVMGCKIFYAGSKKVWYGGAKSYFSIFTKHLNIEKEKEIEYVAFAAALIKKDSVKELKFDEKLMMYGEDNEFCQRVRLNGYKILYYPYAEAFHHIKENRISRHEEYFSLRNNAYVYSKYLNLPLKILYLIGDIFVFFNLLVLYRIYKNPKRIMFWKEILKARFDSIKLWMS